MKKNSVIAICAVSSAIIFGAISSSADNNPVCNTFLECAQLVIDKNRDLEASLAELNNLTQKIDTLEQKISGLTEQTDQLKNSQMTYEYVPGNWIRTVDLDSRTARYPGATPLEVNYRDGYCQLTRVQGRFDGDPEEIRVYVSNSSWYYVFDSGAARILGQIQCFEHGRLIATSTHGGN